MPVGKRPRETQPKLPKIPKKQKTTKDPKKDKKNVSFNIEEGEYTKEYREYNIRDPPCPNVKATDDSMSLVNDQPTKNCKEERKKAEEYKKARGIFFREHGFTEKIIEKKINERCNLTKIRWVSQNFHPGSRFPLKAADWVAAEMGTTVKYP